MQDLYILRINTSLTIQKKKELSLSKMSLYCKNEQFSKYGYGLYNILKTS